MSAACLLERYFEDEGLFSIPAESCGYPPPRDLELLDYNLVREYIRNTYTHILDAQTAKFEKNSNRIRVSFKSIFAISLTNAFVVENEV